jgi:hypothetical protein
MQCPEEIFVVAVNQRFGSAGWWQEGSSSVISGFRRGVNEICALLGF